MNEDLRVNTGNAAEKKDIKLNSVWGLGNMSSLGKCFAIVLFRNAAGEDACFQSGGDRTNYLDTI